MVVGNTLISHAGCVNVQLPYCFSLYIGLQVSQRPTVERGL